MRVDAHPSGEAVCRARRAGARAVAALAFVLLLPMQTWGQDWLYTVRPGDNIWDLSQKYLIHQGYWQRLQQYNNVDDPFTLPPGSLLRMPVRWLKIQPASAEALQVTGDVELFRVGTATSRPLVAGTELFTGDRLVTGAGGSVTVRFADGSRLLVQQGSEVTFDGLSAYGATGMVDTDLRLQRGRIDNRVEPAAGPASRFRIITPAAVAASRGTDFRIGADESDGATRGEVLDGSIGVAGGGVSRVVPAGFGLVARAGAAPSEPRELLPGPDLSRLPRVLERLVLEFRWSAIAGAESYRIQIFADPAREDLLLDRIVREPETSLPAPPDGNYSLRVRGIDEQGLEGLDADHEFRLNARPEPPVPLQPIQGLALRQGTEPELWWSVPADAESFAVQLASDRDFTALLVDIPDYPKDRLGVGEALPPGEYFWRVATRDGAGDLGPFSVVRGFRIQVVPASPEAQPAEIGEEQVQFAWHPAAGAASYDFELARDAEFTRMIEQRPVEETSLTLDTPAPGIYYFRTRGISDEGVVGPYSTVNRMEIPSDPPYWLLLLLLIPILLL